MGEDRIEVIHGLRLSRVYPGITLWADNLRRTEDAANIVHAYNLSVKSAR